MKILNVMIISLLVMQNAVAFGNTDYYIIKQNITRINMTNVTILNEFDQSLNTTDNVTFNSYTVGGDSAIIFPTTTADDLWLWRYAYGIGLDYSGLRLNNNKGRVEWVVWNNSFWDLDINGNVNNYGNLNVSGNIMIKNDNIKIYESDNDLTISNSNRAKIALDLWDIFGIGTGKTAYFFNYGDIWQSFSGSGNVDDGTNFNIPYADDGSGFYIGYGGVNNPVIIGGGTGVLTVNPNKQSIFEGNLTVTDALTVNGLTTLQILKSGAINSTGQVRTAAGTASSPSHSFTADANTGMRRSAEDTLALVTGGADRVIISNSGLNSTVNVNTEKNFSVSGVMGVSGSWECTSYPNVTIKGGIITSWSC